MSKFGRREFLGALAGGLMAAKEGFSQETKKTPEQRISDLEKRSGQLTETLKWLQEGVKASGITKSQVDALEQKGGTVFLGDLQQDFKLFESIDQRFKDIEELNKSSQSLKSGNLTPDREQLLVSLEAELKLMEDLGYADMKNSRWDMNAVESKLAATPKNLAVTGFGNNASKVQNTLKDVPPSLLATFNRIQSGAETDTKGTQGNYYGHQSYGSLGGGSSNERVTLTLDSKILNAPDFDQQLKFELAWNFNWDEIDGLSLKERMEWYQQAVELQANGNLKDERYEQRLQDFYKKQLEPNVKDGGLSEQQAQTILSRSRIARFAHIATHRFMTDANFSQQNPAESAFAKKWLDRANSLKIKVNVEAN